MIRSAWINLDTGIVENIIVADDRDLQLPYIKAIPFTVDSNNNEIFLPVEINNSKWVDGVGFTDLTGTPITYVVAGPTGPRPTPASVTGP